MPGAAQIFVLLHAPVLGPASWLPVADQLASSGNQDRLVLVAHSGAGIFVPYLAEAIAAREAVAVFVDAAVPESPGPVQVVDSGFLPFLRDIASRGMVPPWPRWWPADELSALFPDDAIRREVEAEARQLPLGFFEETMQQLPDSWSSCRTAYLVFSEAYRLHASEASQRGWPVRELPGEHLHMLVRPSDVAAAIASLAAQALGIDPRSTRKEAVPQ